MSLTVNAAFDLFLREKVRIAKDRSDRAKLSKSNLIGHIAGFPGDGIFPRLHPDLYIDFGSFSRKTKKRPLDDIDIMIILHAEGNTRVEFDGHYKIFIKDGATRHKALCNDGTNELNSTKVLNMFRRYLYKVPHYRAADIKKNLEAMTLTLDSYEWTFDIVPCFKTIPDSFGNSFFLIPDGKGNWKASDPRIDKERIQDVNSKQKVSVLDMVRLMKYWTARNGIPTISSYFLECLILSYYESESSIQYVDCEFTDLLGYVIDNVMDPMQDPKGFCEDINNLSNEEISSVRVRAAADRRKGIEAQELERTGDHRRAIAKWKEVFGYEFPAYG